MLTQYVLGKINWSKGDCFIRSHTRLCLRDHVKEVCLDLQTLHSFRSLGAYFVKFRLNEYSTRQKITIFAGSYNLNGQPYQGESLEPWILQHLDRKLATDWKFPGHSSINVYSSRT